MHTYLNDLSVFYVGNTSGNSQYQLIRKTDKLILAQGQKSQPLIDLCEVLRALQALTETEIPINTSILLAAIGKLIDSKGGKHDKAKITIEGDQKLMGYLYAQIRQSINPETSPLTKVTMIELRTPDEHKITFEIESRI